MLSARYDIENKDILCGVSSCSLWKNMQSILKGECAGLENRFKNIYRSIENGENTLFWRDPWLVVGPLCERFSRLMVVRLNKNSLVVEMARIGGV